MPFADLVRPAPVQHPALDLDPTAATRPPVVRATESDLSYVVHLQKRFGDAIGFLPRVALEDKIRRGQVWLVTENDDPAGFLHHGSLARPEVRVFQAAVQLDARRRHLASALVEQFVARAAAAGASGVSLRCLSYLDANEFWPTVGFELLSCEPGAKGKLNVWVRRLDQACADGAPAVAAISGSAPAFAFNSRLHPCARCGRLTADTWTRGAVRRRLCAACVAQAPE